MVNSTRENNVSSDPSYKTFIIHLQRAKKRKKQVKRIVAKSPFDVEIINAIDGATLSLQEINEYYSETPLHLPLYPFPLNTGEVGCFLSHRNAWQQIIDQELTAGLIFEDDLKIDTDIFYPALEIAKSHIQELGYIQFPVRPVPKNSKVIINKSHYQILQSNIPRLRTSAQLVSHTTAKTLLEKTAKFDRPVDTTLQMHWVTGIHPVSLMPSGIIDQTENSGGSTLALKHNLSSNLSREWNRALYRMKIKRLSKKHYKLYGNSE